MPDAVIGLGTNLGDRLTHLRAAVRGLRAMAPALRVRAVSPIYESDALVPPGAPDDWRLPYLNLAVRAEWDGTPQELIAALKALEAALGRQPRPRWAPREADLDLLAFGDLALAGDTLTLPHRDLAERPFALLPLVDVAAEWSFPPDAAVHAGQPARELARRWRGAPEHVPFRTRRTALSLTEIVGVVNLTPDSFSDGGRFPDPDAAVEHALALVEAGATVLDLGAESTRPGAAALASGEEWGRLEPVLSRLTARGTAAILSVDTRHTATARRALAAGARWINDVAGGTDPHLVDAVAASDAHFVVMHSLTVPPVADRVIPLDRDPVDWLIDWGRERREALALRGIPAPRLILDPGIGFGKTPGQSTAILRDAGRLTGLGTRILVGHSRKSFLRSWYPAGHEAVANPLARDFESGLLAGHLARAGIDYVRVHHAELARRAIAAAALIG